MIENFESFLHANMDDADAREAAARSAVVCLATPGTPVIFVSASFEEYTGYSSEEIVGKSLAILQGPDTEAFAVRRFRDLIRNCEPGVVTITNYRKDGSKFFHACELRPIFDASGVATHFIAIQRLV